MVSPVIYRRLSCLFTISIALFGPAHAESLAFYSPLAGSDPMCTMTADFLNSESHSSPNFQRPQDQKADEQLQVRLPPPLSGTRSYFDFNNDGQIDEVFTYDNEGSYISGTILYVRLGGPSRKTTKAPISINELNIYPCQFDPRSGDSSHCPPYSQDGDDMGIEVRISGLKKPVFFRGRYTDITPVLNAGKTYLVLRSNSADTSRYAALIEPQKNGAFRSVCLLRAR